MILILKYRIHLAEPQRKGLSEEKIKGNFYLDSITKNAAKKYKL